MDKIIPEAEPQTCPCCGQLVKLYKRTITHSMVYHLIKLYKLQQQSGSSQLQFFHMRQIGTPKSGGGDFSKLQYWGLIAPMAHVMGAKKTSGKWRITTEGMRFVRNKLMVEKYAEVYNGSVQQFSGGMINVTDAINQQFDYKKLMEQ